MAVYLGLGPTRKAVAGTLPPPGEGCREGPSPGGAAPQDRSVQGAQTEQHPRGAPGAQRAPTQGIPPGAPPQPRRPPGSPGLCSGCSEALGGGLGGHCEHPAPPPGPGFAGVRGATASTQQCPSGCSDWEVLGAPRAALGSRSWFPSSSHTALRLPFPGSPLPSSPAQLLGPRSRLLCSPAPGSPPLAAPRAAASERKSEETPTRWPSAAPLCRELGSGSVAPLRRR